MPGLSHLWISECASLKENPHQPNLDVLMGNLYQSKSDWKSAEDAYQKALAINSQDPVASVELDQSKPRYVTSSPEPGLPLTQLAQCEKWPRKLFME